MLNKGFWRIFICAFFFSFTALAASTEISVRSGIHSNFNRLVFDQAGSLPYSLSQQNGQVVLDVQKELRLNLSAINLKALPLIKEIISQTPQAGATRIVITPSGKSGYKSFVNEGNLVIDILKPVNEAKISTLTPKQAQEDARKREVVATPLENKPEPEALGKVREEKKEAPAVQKAETPPIAKLAPASGTLPDIFKPKSMEFFSGLSDDPSNRLLGDLPFLIEKTDRGIKVEFAFDREVPASIFKRGNRIFAVFDRPLKLIMSPESIKDRSVMTSLRQLDVKSATVVEIHVLPGINPQVSRNADSWILTFIPSTFAPDVPAQVLSEPESLEGPRVAIPMEAARSVVEFTDPVVGDTLFAGTSVALGRGVPESYRFIDFELLPSVQGVGVVALSDNLILKSDDTFFSVQNSRGLRLAPTDLKEEAKQGLRIFRFDDWRREDKGNFIRAENDFFKTLSMSGEYQKPAIWYDLARFYIGYGFWSEGISILEKLTKVDPDMAKKPEMISLLGAGHFMLSHYDKAYEYLLSPQLDAYPEVALWRGGLAAKQALWDTALQQFAEGGAIPSSWPTLAKEKLSFLAIDTALATDRAPDAERILQGFESSLDRNDFRKLSRARVFDYHSARIAYAQGKVQEAIDLWQKSSASDDQYVRTRSEFELINAQLKKKAITVPEAIERLERLRFAWRAARVKPKNTNLKIVEEDFEFKVLEALGRAYVENGDYRKALSSLRDAIAAFDQVRDTSALSKLMTDTFDKLFYEGEADKMPALKALALFDEFRELAPVDEKGDVMIEKLVDRIVALDLLDRASELLEYQVKFRLKGLEKSRIGTRLALVYILNNDPKKALATLEETEGPGISNELKRQRRLLKARALFETGKGPQAIALLFNDFDQEADLLRADIYWRSQEWELAGNVIERLLDQAETLKRQKPESFSDNQIREMILNLTVAYALARKEDEVIDLRRRYAREMAGSPYADIFNLITDSTFNAASPEGISTFNELSKRFAKIDMFERFINAYRQQLLTQGLSSVN